MISTISASSSFIKSPRLVIMLSPYPPTTVPSLEIHQRKRIFSLIYLIYCKRYSSHFFTFKILSILGLLRYCSPRSLLYLLLHLWLFLLRLLFRQLFFTSLKCWCSERFCLWLSSCHVIYLTTYTSSTVMASTTTHMIMILKPLLSLDLVSLLDLFDFVMILQSQHT